MTRAKIKINCTYSDLINPKKLVPHPKNPNQHPQRQIDILCSTITQVGFRRPIIVSERSGFVVAGHGRLLAALQLGMDAVPVDTQAYESEAEEYADLVADNSIPELVEMDEVVLSGIIEDLREKERIWFSPSCES